MPDEPDPPPKKLALKRAEFESVNEPASAAAPPDNDAMDILRRNREHEVKIGYAELPPPPTQRISRRNREYLLILTVGNLIIGTLLFFSGDSATFVFLIAGMALLSAGLTWVMLFVIDDY